MRIVEPQDRRVMVLPNASGNLPQQKMGQVRHTSFDIAPILIPPLKIPAVPLYVTLQPRQRQFELITNVLNSLNAILQLPTFTTETAPLLCTPSYLRPFGILLLRNSRKRNPCNVMHLS